MKFTFKNAFDRILLICSKKNAKSKFSESAEKENIKSQLFSFHTFFEHLLWNYWTSHVFDFVGNLYFNLYCNRVLSFDDYHSVASHYYSLSPPFKLFAGSKKIFPILCAFYIFLFSNDFFHQPERFARKRLDVPTPVYSRLFSFVFCFIKSNYFNNCKSFSKFNLPWIRHFNSETGIWFSCSNSSRVYFQHFFRWFMGKFC